MFWLQKLFFVFIFFMSIIFVLDYNMEKLYVFDQNKLHEIAKKVIEKQLPTKELITVLLDELKREYPGHINVEQRWVFNNAGGAMGAMIVVHCSITEYLLIFGSPIGTIGHTGRYFADDYFMILEGEQWAFSEGQLEKEIYKPGDIHHLKRGSAQAYRIPNRAWALEYARGWIPAMMPFGIIEVFTSTMDFFTLYNTFDIYIRGVIGQLLIGKI